MESAQIIQGSRAIYNYVQANNFTGLFSGSIVGELMGAPYNSNLWKELLQTIVIVQSTSNPNSTTARYIHVGEGQVRVNVKFPEWNPVAPQTTSNLKTLGRQAQQQREADITWQVNAQPDRRNVGKLIIPPGMRRQTVKLYMSRLKRCEGNLLKMRSFASFLIRSKDAQKKFKYLWKIALYNRSWMHSVYDALFIAAAQATGSLRQTFLNTMFKLNANEIIEGDKIEFVIPSGMYESTALSCWFMLVRMRTNNAHYYDVMQWMMEYDETDLIAYSFELLSSYNLALLDQTGHILDTLVSCEADAEIKLDV